MQERRHPPERPRRSRASLADGSPCAFGDVPQRSHRQPARICDAQKPRFRICQRCRHFRQEQSSGRPGNPHDLADESVFGKIVQGIDADETIERAIRERQAVRVSLAEIDAQTPSPACGDG